ncbi:MAG: DUF488 domain-containing protein [Actinomycetota bacterium]|nr:DUF488 domain-containing protein [Actinomycetota bacterium]
MRVFTIGHGTRPAEELLACLEQAGVQTLVDVRRFPGSRRNPQFNRDALAATLEAAGVSYVHAEALGGRRTGEPGEERFGCIREGAFRSYAARMGRPEWQTALAEALTRPAPCFLCAETLWWRCHRRLIAELLEARSHEVVHLLEPHRAQRHRPADAAEHRGGKLFLCGYFVA